jgi:xanthine dehydrogenase accessory factor
MREIIAQLVTAIRENRQVAYCRLVETRGSTPQKAGAMMLVFADGTQAGTLGGGCVEADVKRRALAVMQSGQAEIAKFQLDSDYGWDDGLICGGRMLALIETVLPGARAEYFFKLHEMAQRGEPLTEAIVFDEAASGLPATQSYLFDEHERLVAQSRTDFQSARPDASQNAIAEDGLQIRPTLTAPSVITENLQSLSTRPRPYAAHGIAYLPVFRRSRLVVVGGGHVGQAVADLAAELDFEVWVTDDRADIISRERFPKAAQRIAGPVEQALPPLEITPETYCLIVTRGHNHDEEALYYLADRGAAYVGLIGSRRKIKMIFEDLLEQGLSPLVLEKVHAPVGIDIGSQTVPEIAVSICAELVAHRNLGRIPGRPEAVMTR